MTWPFQAVGASETAPSYARDNMDDRPPLRAITKQQPQQLSAAPPPPALSAWSWAVADARSGRVLFERRAREAMHVASLTKVVTALVVLGLDGAALDELVVVSEAAARTKSGTHAELRAGDVLCVRELLYALLLPSGNDAAVALAEHFGARFEPPADGRALCKGLHYAGRWSAASAVGRFVAEMNRCVAALGCRHTVFVNPHGMVNEVSRSTARDVLRFTRGAMEKPFFRTVVGTARFRCSARSRDEDGSGAAAPREFEWANTNECLHSPQFRFEGCKTGWVPLGRRIHGCLVTCVRPALAPGSAPPGTDKAAPRLLVVTLGSEGKAQRFEDMHCLVDWAFRQLGATDSADYDAPAKAPRKMLEQEELPKITAPGASRSRG